MLTMAETSKGARLRAAVDRLHAAQLEALAARAAADAPEEARDAFGADRELLDLLGELGSLLVRLGWLAPGDGEAAAMRRRLVTLAVGSANTLAELVSLAFEVEGGATNAGEESGEGESGDAGEPGARLGGACAVVAAVSGGASEASGRRRGGSNGASSPGTVPTSMRAVTDANRLLVEQLKRLMQNASRQEGWRSARPGELWRGLLRQVGGLLPLVAELEGGALSEAGTKELGRLAADAANYLAFIRFYPRLPTA